MYLLDTNILIDLLKSKPEAISLTTRVPKGKASISVISVHELYRGAREKEIPALQQLISKFDILELDAATSKLSGELAKQFQPSHGIDALDCMIAATAVVHDLQLITLNLKHFRPIFPKLERPY